MKKWIFRLSIALNILVIVLALGAWLNRDVFIRAFLAELYAAKVNFFASFPLQSTDVVMLGDSITEAGEWSEIFPVVAIRNRGIPGDTTTGVLARLQAIIDAQPAAVFLKIGTNDLTHGPEREVSYRQYRDIVTRLRKGSPTTDIYLQSVLPRQIEFRGEVEEYNRHIEAIADDLGATYIDLYPEFQGTDGAIRGELTLDEVHLTGEGYRLWQSRLAPIMSDYQTHLVQ
jgi:hexosaminidase